MGSTTRYVSSRGGGVSAAHSGRHLSYGLGVKADFLQYLLQIFDVVGVAPTLDHQSGFLDTWKIKRMKSNLYFRKQFLFYKITYTADYLNLN